MNLTANRQLHRANAGAMWVRLLEYEIGDCWNFEMAFGIEKRGAEICCVSPQSFEFLAASIGDGFIKVKRGIVLLQ